MSVIYINQTSLFAEQLSLDTTVDSGNIIFAPYSYHVFANQTINSMLMSLHKYFFERRWCSFNIM